MNQVPPHIIEELKKIHSSFIWKGKKTKIKHSSLIGDFASGGYKDIDIDSKIKSLHLMWVKRLCDKNFHPWKIIPLGLLASFGGTSIFHPNLSTSTLAISPQMLEFYVHLINLWENYVTANPTEKIQNILAESIWNKSHLQINHKSFYDPKFADAGINLLIDLFDENGIFQTWTHFYNKGISGAKYFRHLQIKDSIPMKWRLLIKNESDSSIFKFPTRAEIKESHTSYMAKLSDKMIYSQLIKSVQKPPTSQTSFERKLNLQGHINWGTVYSLPRKVTIDETTRIFQYGLLHNILFLNKHLHKMKITDTAQCSFCNSADETNMHLFAKCVNTENLWSALQSWLGSTCQLPNLDPRNALLGFPVSKSDLSLLTNYILLIFKCSLCEARGRNIRPNIHFIKARIMQTECIEFFIAK